MHFEGQEVGEDTGHCVHLLSELEGGWKGLQLIIIQEVGHDVEHPPRVFDRDVTYGKVIDYLSWAEILLVTEGYK